MRRLLRRVKKQSSLPAPQSQPDKDSSPHNVPVPPFPAGVKVWHDCPDATVDICFIHGLTGDRDSTWTADGQSTPWPETFLPSELSKARLLTYGYDAYIVRVTVASKNRLIDHATNLLTNLETNRARHNATSRPLIFVAHSLGGLVCKEAILLSRDHPESHLCSIFNSTKGIIFMGTPHKGAWMASWAKIPAKAIGLVKSTNKSLLAILETNDQYLESIQVRFMSMVRQQREHGRTLELTCFLEELPMPVAGQVVHKESAMLEGYTPITIHANHRDMVKFSSAQENGFQMLVGVLIRWKSQLEAQNSPITLSKTAQDCLRSLAFPEMHDRSHGIDRATSGTCEWLFQHRTYRSWAARDRGLLWIKGKAGSGKSTLLKYALENHRAGSGDLVISFFFHGRGSELQKSRSGLSRSILHEVLRQAPDTLLDLVDAFEKKRQAMGEPGEKWQWHPNELMRFFEISLPKILASRPVWLFVDALDECGKDDAVDLIDHFKSLLKNSPVPSNSLSRFHICFSCRPYPILNLEGEFEISPDNENRDDISVFVDSRLSEIHLKTPSNIAALITNRAAGVFLWADLVVKQVLNLNREGVGSKKIEAMVYSIPPELDELYEGLIKHMTPASLKMIQWICFATRSLSVDELRWAMAIDADCPHRSLQACQIDENYISDNERMKRRIQTLSCGLAEVSLPAGDEDDYLSDTDSSSCSSSITLPLSSTQVVQFIHQSVKDFFLTKGLLLLDSSLTSANLAAVTAHFRISKICIRYLSMEEVGRLTRYHHHGFPILEYVTRSWVTHMKQSATESASQNELLELLAWPSNVLVELWTRMYVTMNTFERGCPKPGFNLVHIVSRHGIWRMLTAILQKEIVLGIDSKDEDGMTPLSYAARDGNEAVVKMLLDTGQVEINSKDNYGCTPLSYAAGNGNEAVVKMLLDTSQVEINSKNEDGRTPLSYAAEYGNEAVIKMLLGIDQIDINSKDKSGRTPLSYAAAYGKEAVVKLLLVTGQVEIDSKDEDGRTPLSYAAKNGNEAFIKLLLDTSQVEINSKDEDGRTPLAYAAQYGNEAVIKLLLGIDQIDINSKDKSGRTPLSYAAAYGNEAVIKLLFDTGQVEIDSKDKYGRTPLAYAAGYGDEIVGKLLFVPGQVGSVRKMRTAGRRYHMPLRTETRSL